MHSADEKVIHSVLSKLLRSVDPLGKSMALVSEAQTLLSEDELKSLKPEQLKIWKTLSAPNRQLEWSEARRLEFRLRQALGQGHPLYTSISHTRMTQEKSEGRPIVFAVGVIGSVVGVGVDVELASRDVSEAVAERFMDASERRWGLSPIQIWVIKEALYKSYPSNSGTTLSEYRIEDYNPKELSGTAAMGGKKFVFALIPMQSWVGAVALSV